MANAATPAGSASSRPASVMKLALPEKRATEAFQVGRRIFEDFDCLPATFWDTLDAPIQLQNESRNHLQIGAELSPETASEMD